MKNRILTRIMAMISFLALALPLQSVAQHTRYTVKDLGTLGGTFSTADGMNDRHWIAGGATLAGDTAFHAALWRPGHVTDLGTLGGPSSNATDRISENGQISGYAETTIVDPLGEHFCGSEFTCLAFLWRKGRMSPLPTLGGNNAGGAQVNNKGQVVGTAEDSTLDATCDFPHLQIRPVIWYRGGLQELPTFPGDNDGLSLGITDSGIAVGSSGNCTGPFHALLWENGVATDLGNLGGTLNNEAVAINNQLQVVGRSGLPGDAAFHAFLWQNRTMRDLGTLAGDFFSFAFNINSKGQVVGGSYDVDGNARAFLWQNGVMRDLNTLIPAESDLFLLEAHDVNSRGEIVGIAFQVSTGEAHAFLATPIQSSDHPTFSPRREVRESPKLAIPENFRKMLRLYRPGLLGLRRASFP